MDYYGVTEWPGIDAIPQGVSPSKIAQIVNDATQRRVGELFPELRTDKRFIPYMAIHEFEALLFSDSGILASKLNLTPRDIDAVLEECGEPEAINNDPKTAPSKRLTRFANGCFSKTRLGISIAREIGVPKMRRKCPVFNHWLEQLESLAHE